MSKYVWCKNANTFYQYSIKELSESDTSVLFHIDFQKGIGSILQNFLTKGENGLVLIKTSVTGKRNNNHEISYDILETVVKHTREILPLSRIALVDGPAYAPSYKIECKKLGWDQIAYKYNVEIIDLNFDDFCLIEKKWPLSKLWYSADKIINLCKAKTHKRFGVTLSNKNLLGAFSGKELGYPKFSNTHMYVPRLLWMMDKITTSRLNIIDGVHGIEGNGPMKGKPTNSNFIVVGTNSMACDFQATIEMGFAPCITIGCIRPFKTCNITDDNITISSADILSIRKTSVDYLPNISNSWMYKTVFDEPEALNERYLILKNGIQKCWKIGI